MAKPDTETITLDEIHALALAVFSAQGCDEDNASALARTVTNAERDGSVSHGIFRIPGYVASLQSGKVKGDAAPKVRNDPASVVSVDGDGGFTPLALERGLPVLAEAAGKTGVAAMRVFDTYHFAALWPESEYLAEQGLVGLACTSFAAMVAPLGAKQAFFGTNPISFAWPRPGHDPVVFDMATSTLAKGDVQIAARDGHGVPPGTGLGPDGKPSDDPAEILKGVLLPFGGYKGGAIALMVELLAGGLTGDNFSYEATEKDNKDGGPSRGGEFLMAIDPSLVAGDDWSARSGEFIKRLEALEGVRIPGQRRHRNRLDDGPRSVNAELLEKVRGLC